MLLKYCWTAVTLTDAVLGGPLERRAAVAHDSLNPIATRVQTGANGAAITRFNPKLHIASGCQPYTAVDDAGNTRLVPWSLCP